MKRTLRSFITISVFCVILVMIVLFLKTGLNEEQIKENQEMILAQENPDSIKSISISNEFGGYKVSWENNILKVGDLPPELINMEYVFMLLDESSTIKSTSLVEENAEDLSKYGLGEPNSEVEVEYADGSLFKLNIGNVESITDSRYICLGDQNDVYLIQRNRTIRFTMPIEKYIHYIIIPPNETQEVLKSLQDVTFSGKLLSTPIELKAVLAGRTDILNKALSFGAVTHLITKPALHKANPTTLTMVTDSLFGLISEGIVDYNCSEEELAEYGFDTPLLRIEFDYKNGDNPVEHYDLKLAKTNDYWIATLNNQGVIYRIAEVGFLNVDYEQLVSRWFFSPLIIEISSIDVAFEGNNYRFDLSGETAKNLSVKYEDMNLDVDLFRKYYNLLVSAAIEDKLPINDELDNKDSVLRIVYHYRDGDKTKDSLTFHTMKTPRRVLADTNDTIEFTSQEKFVEYVVNATKKLIGSETFETNWQ